eukprot:1563049-Rhodomonas_salina.5
MQETRVSVYTRQRRRLMHREALVLSLGVVFAVAVFFDVACFHDGKYLQRRHKYLSTSRQHATVSRPTNFSTRSGVQRTPRASGAAASSTLSRAPARKKKKTRVKDLRLRTDGQKPERWTLGLLVSGERFGQDTARAITEKANAGHDSAPTAGARHAGPSLISGLRLPGLR